MILIEAGDPGGMPGFIQRGLVRACTARDDGQEFTFGYFGADEYLGELSLDGGLRSASVVVEHEVSCRIVARSTIEQAIAAHPSLASERLAKVISRARDLSCGRATWRSTTPAAGS